MSEGAPKTPREESEEKILAYKQAMETEEQYLLTAKFVEEKLTILSRDMEVLRQNWDAPVARQAYEKCRNKLEVLRDRFEDVTRSLQGQGSLRGEVVVVRERLSEFFSQAAQDDIRVQKMEHARVLLEYNDKVRDIIEEVQEIEKRHPTDDQLDDIWGKLQNLDAEYSRRHVHPAQSTDRKKLIFLIHRLRERRPANLAAAINMHQRVWDAYAKVSHTLREDQRRIFRIRIAELSSLVRRARHEHIHATAVSAISRATELAPALSWEALKKRS